jgi:Ca2+-binding EF-hand superfamily protein
MENPVINRMLPLALLASAIATPALAQNQATSQQAQPVSKAAFLQQVDAAFTAVDTNKDGFTDRAEIESAQAKSLATRKTQVIQGREAAFKELDKDKNGSLTLAEFNAVIAAQPLPKADASPFLQRLDANKDGKVSLAENRTPATAQFDRADTNKDGSLSPAERQRAGGN